MTTVNQKPKQTDLEKLQYRRLLSAAAEHAGKPVTDGELFALMSAWDQATTLEDVTKTVTLLLKDGEFVLSKTQVPDANGRKMLRLVGLVSTVPDGYSLADLKRAKDEAAITNMATVLAVRLATSLRRRENIDVPVIKLSELLHESLTYVVNTGGVKTALNLLNGDEHVN